MNLKRRNIILCVLAILIVLCLSMGLTRAFMKPIKEQENLTSVSLNTCAQLTLKDTGASIDLSNSYPMSQNSALNTTPYTFTVSSSCGEATAFTLYLATSSTNTLSSSYISYIITRAGSKKIIKTGTLSSNVQSSFTSAELAEYKVGMQGNISGIYNLYNDNLKLEDSSSYDLYLYVSSSAGNTVKGTFKGGVAVKTSAVETGTSYTLDCTKAVQTKTINASGYYYLQVWGASGGNSSSSYTNGGKGGYSSGYVYLTKNDVLSVYVGGTPADGSTSGRTAGGYNGGGYSSYGTSGGGGGATDIRINSTSLYARVIVAGGGGGGGYYSTSYTGGVGGGTEGGTPSAYSTTYQANPGTISAGGARPTTGTYYGSAGTFGTGGAATTNSSTYAHSGGGGGGWYGGSGGNYYGSSTYNYGVTGGGGGSGWVYTEANYNTWSTAQPTSAKSWLLTPDYYVIKGTTVKGSTTFESTTGGTETGHSGNGYAKITFVGASIPK